MPYEPIWKNIPIINPTIMEIIIFQIVGLKFMFFINSYYI